MSAVQSDLANFRKKLMVYGLENGAYPVNSTELAEVGLRFSGASNYDMRPGYSNIYYCADLAGAKFAVGVRAADNPTSSFFVADSSDSQLNSGLITQTVTCSKIGVAGTSADSYSTGGVTAAGSVSPWLQ